MALSLMRGKSRVGTMSDRLTGVEKLAVVWSHAAERPVTKVAAGNETPTHSSVRSMLLWVLSSMRIRLHRNRCKTTNGRINHVPRG